MIGNIYGVIGNKRFMFEIKPEQEEVAEVEDLFIGAYVEVHHEDGFTYLGQINEIKIYTKKSKEEKKDIIDRNSADVIVIGRRDKEGLLRIPSTPFRPESPVYLATVNSIKSTLDLFEGENRAYLGLMEKYELPIYLDINRFLETNILVVRSSKYDLIPIIAEELLEKNVPTVIVDMHGEYWTLKNPDTEIGKEIREKYNISAKDYKESVVEYSPSPDIGAISKLSFEGNNPDASIFFDLFKEWISAPQIGILQNSIKKLRKKDVYTLGDIIKRVQKSNNDEKEELLLRLEEIEKAEIFSKIGVDVEEIVKRKRTTIINLKDVNDHLKAIVFYLLLTTLIEGRRRNEIGPFVLIINDIEFFAPAGREKGTTELLEEFSLSGRKLGISLIGSTENASNLSPIIINQSNLRILGGGEETGEKDRQSIASLIFEDVHEGYIKSIVPLPGNQFLISGMLFPAPIIFEPRPRRTKQEKREHVRSEKKSREEEEIAGEVESYQKKIKDMDFHAKKKELDKELRNIDEVINSIDVKGGKDERDSKRKD